MAKYLVKGAYNPEGTRGLAKDGGTGRRKAVQAMTEALGGKLEAFYYAYGEDDVYLICDFPDQATALGVSLAVNASGAVRVSLVPLITAEEMDAACKKSVGYRAPGA
ncbi:MAG TPA: GYD domain-containing protein [Vicinamibacterales bacterium]|jgi:uncharacterized protein with GYD domain|nr:GYD domain-containing protein [Vicinamibacterales bacterium]